MNQMVVNFETVVGPMKPMHAVNNGPFHKYYPDQRISNLEAFREAGIPYARNHDATQCAEHGGEHTVDVHVIFPNFDADPEDPANYDFQLTDEYVYNHVLAGTEMYYRLGAGIEHNRVKYGTLPPKDFKKWAVICEHIIRHYNYGWADGFHYNLKYWSVWAESDMNNDDDDPTSKMAWGGTRAQFFEFYDTAARHLKACFPELKIGGIGLCSAPHHKPYFLEELIKQKHPPMDFMEWHVYCTTPERIRNDAIETRKLLDRYGYTETENIVGEYNYVKGWTDENWIYTLKMEKSIKAAGFIAANMCMGQYAPIDMLMYYDTRPGTMNGMFSNDDMSFCLKGYYPFKMFNTLYRMGECVAVNDGENPQIYACAAKNEDGAAIMIANYSDDDNAPDVDVCIDTTGLTGVRAEYYLLDRENDMRLVREETFAGAPRMQVRVPLFGSWLIKLRRVEPCCQQNRVAVDFTQSSGKVKPMHAVNNGPLYKFGTSQRVTNLESYREAGIPYARNHDASYNMTYGHEHTVDVHAIFPNFDADPYDPASYDFRMTEDYSKVIEAGGAKIFYRLGSKIEHTTKKYGTLPPKDFKKWAIICEHIIRHFTEGWADGLHMDIEYWEIWNEPDLDPDDSTHKRCWGGTKAQFFELYDIAASHLKACFPHLKIGGPALAHDMGWARDFLAQLKAPLDFFSWHIYASEPDKIAARAAAVRALLDEFGYTNTESILNEWNYVKGWEDQEWRYSIRSIKSLKGSSFIAATMSLGLYSPVDMLMYYDAQPSILNGLWSTDIISVCLKGYYPIKMFNSLYQLDRAVPVICEGEGVYACAARSETSAAIMLTHFNDNDSTEEKEVQVAVEGFGGGVRAEYWLLDQNRDMELVHTGTYYGDTFKANLKMELFSTYLIKLTKI